MKKERKKESDFGWIWMNEIDKKKITKKERKKERKWYDKSRIMKRKNEKRMRTLFL